MQPRWWADLIENCVLDVSWRSQQVLVRTTVKLLNYRYYFFFKIYVDALNCITKHLFLSPSQFFQLLCVFLFLLTLTHATVYKKHTNNVCTSAMGGENNNTNRYEQFLINCSWYGSQLAQGCMTLQILRITFRVSKTYKIRKRYQNHNTHIKKGCRKDDRRNKTCE